jgi:hypothetical protein
MAVRSPTVPVRSALPIRYLNYDRKLLYLAVGPVCNKWNALLFNGYPYLTSALILGEVKLNIT